MSSRLGRTVDAQDVKDDAEVAVIRLVLAVNRETAVYTRARVIIFINALVLRRFRTGRQ